MGSPGDNPSNTSPPNSPCTYHHPAELLFYIFVSCHCHRWNISSMRTEVFAWYITQALHKYLLNEPKNMLLTQSLTLAFKPRVSLRCAHECLLFQPNWTPQVLQNTSKASFICTCQSCSFNQKMSTVLNMCWQILHPPTQPVKRCLLHKVWTYFQGRSDLSPPPMSLNHCTWSSPVTSPNLSCITVANALTAPLPFRISGKVHRKPRGSLRGGPVSNLKCAISLKIRQWVPCSEQGVRITY